MCCFKYIGLKWFKYVYIYLLCLGKTQSLSIMTYVCMIGVEVCCRKSLWRSCHFGGWSITLGISQVLSLERRWEKAFVDPSGFHNVGFWGLVIFEVWPLKTGKIGIDAGLENGSPHDLQVVTMSQPFLAGISSTINLLYDKKGLAPHPQPPTLPKPCHWIFWITPGLSRGSW